MVEPTTLAGALNAVAGVALAALVGVALGRGAPRWSPRAGDALLGFGVATLALLLVAVPLHAYATLLGVVALSVAWGAAPRGTSAPRGAAWAVGATLGAALAALAAWDLWWVIPFAGLAGGVAIATWQGLRRRA